MKRVYWREAIKRIIFYFVAATFQLTFINNRSEAVGCRIIPGDKFAVRLVFAMVICTSYLLFIVIILFYTAMHSFGYDLILYHYISFFFLFSFHFLLSL